MNAALRAVLLPTLVAGLAACASSPGTAGRSGVQPRPGTMVTDATYVSRVERLASRRYMQVHWVHPPQRRVD